MKLAMLNEDDLLLDHLAEKADRLCSQRYVVFTKKFSVKSFEVLTEANEASDVLPMIVDQKIRCISSNPRLLFDRLRKKLIAAQNELLIMETINAIVKEEAGKVFHYPFHSKRKIM